MVAPFLGGRRRLLDERLVMLRSMLIPVALCLLAVSPLLDAGTIEESEGRRTMKKLRFAH
jgi:hypothetical protein